MHVLIQKEIQKKSPKTKKKGEYAFQVDRHYRKNYRNFYLLKLNSQKLKQKEQDRWDDQVGAREHVMSGECRQRRERLRERHAEKRRTTRKRDRDRQNYCTAESRFWSECPLQINQKSKLNRARIVTSKLANKD